MKVDFSLDFSYSVIILLMSEIFVFSILFQLLHIFHHVRLTAPAQSLTQSSPAALIADQRCIAVFGNQAA